MSFFTIDPGTDHVVLDSEARTGSVVFSVQNKTGARRRVRGIVTVDDPEQQGWYTVGQPVQDAGVDETIQFPVSVSIPATAQAGAYTFRLRAVAEDDPDDVFRDSQSVRVQVPDAEEPKKFPWWIIAVVVAVLLVAGVLIWLFTRNGDNGDIVEPTPPPEETETPGAPGPFPFGIQAGETVPTPGTTSAADSRLAGTVQNDPLRNYFVASDGEVLITGVLQDRVTRSDETGTLIFSPRIRQVSDNGSGATVVALVLSGFEGVAAEANFRTDSLGDKGPTSVSRSEDGDELRFDFSTSPLAGGQVSQFMSVFTEATDFQPNGTFRIIARASNGEVITSDEFTLQVPVSP